MKFWYDNNRAESMYLTHTGPMPKKWKNIGFDWDISYSKWISLLKKLGYFISIVSEPKVVKYDGYKSFDAEIQASKKISDKHRLKIELGFHYSSKIKSNSEGTLYCLDVTIN